MLLFWPCLWGLTLTLQFSDDYFISVGTLLGIYRDNEIIKWDDDIDIDFFDNAYEDIIFLLVRFSQKNKFPYRFGENVFHPKINIFINRVKVSIGKLTKGKIFNEILFRPKTKIPFKYVYPTKIYDFKDMKVRIPANPESYLIHLYGKSWITPIKWDGEDEYLSDYKRSGFQIRFLERVQIFVSQKIIKFFRPVYFAERNFSK